jgi:CheY-like chemotaxis protein
MMARDQITLIPALPGAGRGLRIMVVEDSPDVAETVGLFLKQWGHDCRLCTSGKEALAIAPDFKPNVVLLDIGLPDMDGWEVARRLPSGALLIAVTAHGEAGDFERSQQAGISYHLVKPAFQKQLRELLERLN